MLKHLRIAIAGAGMVTCYHLIGWRRLPDIEIVGISNRTWARAEERAREFAIPHLSEDFEAMLDELRPDAVDIASATETHGPSCRTAAERGIYIFCQKPLTDTLTEAKGLIAQVDDRVRFMVHENSVSGRSTAPSVNGSAWAG
jgi:predicted dehydrogenase